MKIVKISDNREIARGISHLNFKDDRSVRMKQLPNIISASRGLAAIRLGNMIAGYVKKKCFLSLHTTANKLTGLLLLLLPAAILFLDQKTVISVVCAAAIFASVQEGIIFYVGTGFCDED